MPAIRPYSSRKGHMGQGTSTYMHGHEGLRECRDTGREWHRFTKPAWVTGMGSNRYGCGYGFPYP